MPGRPVYPILCSMGGKPTRVTIVGGGVAALETMIALRQLAQERVQLELVTPSAEWTYRPLAVAEPFGVGEAKRYDLVRIARDHSAALHLAGVQAVEPAAHRLVTWDGRRLPYELLVIAVGATPVPSLPGSITINGSAYRTLQNRAPRTRGGANHARRVRGAVNRLVAAAPVRARAHDGGAWG